MKTVLFENVGGHSDVASPNSQQYQTREAKPAIRNV